MKHRMHIRGIAFVFCLAWAALSFCFIKTIPVGLAFHAGESGGAGFTFSRAGGQTENLPPAAIPDGGRVSFSLPLDATHFFFTLPQRAAPYRIDAICVCGVPTFRADWIVKNIAPRGDVYSPDNAARRPGDPLVVKAEEGSCELDYVRFFDLVPRLLRLGRLCVAMAPLALFCLVLAVGFAIRHAKAADWPRVFAVALLLATLLSFPNPVWPSSPGLDPSWTWFLNHFAFARAFGPDVVFTYGPLGFALHPEVSLSNAVAGLVLSLAFAVSWAWTLWTFYTRVPNGRAAAWLLLYSMLFPQMNLEWRLVVLACLSAALPVFLSKEKESPRTALAFSLLAGASLAVNSLVKFTSLTAVLGTEALCFGSLLFICRRHALRCVAAFAVSFAAVFIVFACCLFQSVEAVALWMKGSAATASGYNIYMTAGKSWLELAFPFAIVAAVLLRCAGKGGGVGAFAVFAVASPFVFCAVKYAIVRQSAMPLMYGMVAILAASLAVSPKMRRFAIVFALSAHVVSLALVSPYVLSGMYSGFPFGLNPSGIVKSACLAESVERARMETERNAAGRDMPAEWRDMIGGGSVLFAPCDMGPAMASGSRFKVVPLPSLQLYSGCHPYLDALNGALLEGASAPEWIVFGADVEGCGHMVNHPRFFSALTANYAFVAETDRYILLKLSRNAPGAVPDAAGDGEPVAVKSVRAGEWFDCREFAGMSAAVEWPRSRFGWFCGTFLRASMCHVNVKYDDGSSCRFQFIPGNSAAHPFPLDFICRDDEGVRKVLKGENGPRPVALMFEADVPCHFADEARINICRVGKL